MEEGFRPRRIVFAARREPGLCAVLLERGPIELTTAEADAAISLATCYCFCCRTNKEWIVDGFLAERAEVLHFVPKRTEQFFDFLLVMETGVI